ncbi:hypothetical protein PLESTB_000987600 [Pleodorina starrii]|uniref:UspA domain-containing protein n=1 Tax=Pleodorina starrii TaxID=330485 RepID=A0A9W6BNM5_9CHLO|nr:hypothetical protein PLESTM_000550200 [Pleodorina starrii]GLC55442.1 hypothetical protein PLESTB_000987600 [Pleodorina starrii]GLC73835.1 hypothetical protein PLESTF_001426000 [Pleodorina starrii]
MYSTGGAAPGSAQAGRQILLAIDTTDASVAAAQWAMHEFYRKGDTFHLVHVARILAPQLTIHHQYHATYDVPDTKPPIDERAFIERLKEDIREKITRPMDAHGMPHNLHLFLDTDNAPASAVCDIIFKVAEQVDATILVLAAHGKGEEGGRDPWGTYLGSVADYATRNTQRPVLVVRSYTPPLVVAASRSNRGTAGGVASSPHSPTAGGSSKSLGGESTMS